MQYLIEVRVNAPSVVHLAPCLQFTFYIYCILISFSTQIQSTAKAWIQKGKVTYCNFLLVYVNGAVPIVHISNHLESS